MILYKYKPINNHTIQILEKGEIFFPRKNDLNDPFEFNVVYNTYFASILGPIWLWKRLKRKGESHGLRSFVSALRLKRRFSQKALHDGGQLETIKTELLDKVNKAGILCLSAIRDNVLMWSHYADEHKGICLIFDTSKDSKILSPMWKVRYMSTFPRQNVFSLDEEQKFRALLTTKSKVWSYEKEYRFIWTQGGKVQLLNPDALVGVIFGCRVTKIDKQKVMAALARAKAKRSVPVELYHAQMNKTKYSLDIRRS